MARDEVSTPICHFVTAANLAFFFPQQTSIILSRIAKTFVLAAAPGLSSARPTYLRVFHIAPTYGCPNARRREGRDSASLRGPFIRQFRQRPYLAGDDSCPYARAHSAFDFINQCKTRSWWFLCDSQPQGDSLIRPNEVWFILFLFLYWLLCIIFIFYNIYWDKTLENRMFDQWLLFLWHFKIYRALDQCSWSLINKLFTAKWSIRNNASVRDSSKKVISIELKKISF